MIGGAALREAEGRGFGGIGSHHARGPPVREVSMRTYGSLSDERSSFDEDGEGVGFATPADRARLVYELSQATERRGTCGVRCCDEDNLRFCRLVYRPALGDPVLVRSALLLANALVSILLMVAYMELAWDDALGAYSEYNPEAERVQWIIVIMTGVLELQLLEYYVQRWREKQRNRERLRGLVSTLPLSQGAGSPAATGALRGGAAGGGAEEAVAIRGGVPSFASVKPMAWWVLVVEMLVCAIIPLPNGALGLSERAGLAMFARLYLLVRLVHKASPVSLLRNQISACRPLVGPAAARSLEEVNFDVVLSAKTLFDAQPTMFLLCCLFITYFPLAFCIYVQERDHQPMTLQAALWFAAGSMTTVGYGSFSPLDPWGRVFAVLGACCGVIILSLTVITLTRNLEFTDVEAIAWEVAQRLQQGESRTQASAELGSAMDDGSNFSLADESPLDLPTRLILLRLTSAVTNLKRTQERIVARMETLHLPSSSLSLPSDAIRSPPPPHSDDDHGDGAGLGGDHGTAPKASSVGPHNRASSASH